MKKKIINTATDEVKLSITLLQGEGKQLKLNKKKVRKFNRQELQLGFLTFFFYTGNILWGKGRAAHGLLYRTSFWYGI